MYLLDLIQIIQKWLLGLLGDYTYGTAITKRADLRPGVYPALHANILDAFHTAGVEITSPLYRAMRDGNEPAMAHPEFEGSE